MLGGMYTMDFILSTKSGQSMGNEQALVRRRIKGPTSGRAWRKGIYPEP